MINLFIWCTFVVGISYLFAVIDGDTAIQAKTLNLNVQRKQNISTCDLCELLVGSFNKGMRRTAKGRFGGGNTAWEEKNLGSYTTSETRLVEIQEVLCKDEDTTTREVCHTLAEIWEQHLENWWLRDRKAFPNLRQYLCETIMKVCTPTVNTTQRCPTGFTRVVDKGCFDVDECLSNPCKRNEFCSNSEGSFSCSPCHSACNGCTGSGRSKCKKLKREREKRSVEEMFENGKLLNLSWVHLFVLLTTVLVILVPCAVCLLVLSKYEMSY